MAYVISSLSKTAIYVDDNGDSNEVILATIFVDSPSSIQDLPSDVAVGSIAHQIGLSKGWQKDFDGTWKEVSL